MEVEAKFVIPDHDTLLRLRRAVRLGPFTLGDRALRQVRDLYLDTTGHVLYQNGLACRLRWESGSREITLKGLGQGETTASLQESAIHERFESSLALPDESTIDPSTWPEWSGRDLVLSLAGEDALEELFIIDQDRYVCPLQRDGRPIAELSVDEVRVLAAGHRQEISVLEAELGPEGEMDDLRDLVHHLTTTWGLGPDPRTKFERGWALLESEDTDELSPHTATSSSRISARERTEIERLLERAGDDQLVRRARLILGWSNGEPVDELCQQVGFSLSWSYKLIKRFREERLGFFGASGPEETALSIDTERQVSTTTSVDDASTGLRGQEMTIDEVCERFRVDVAHARQVRDLALALFDATRSIHKLGAERRHLLGMMGLLHNVGLEIDAERHHVAGSEAILGTRLEGVSEVEQQMIAAAVYLHRKRIRRKRLRAEVVTSVPPDVLDDTLALSALLRLADGLDYSQTQSSALDDVQVSSAVVHVIVSGPHAREDADRAQTKADLWRRLFDVPVFFSILGSPLIDPVSREGESEAASASSTREVLLTVPVADSPGILPGDEMSEAGRKVLYFHFVRMLKHEPGTRAGGDIEELHDMRVATRRMRSAFRVFGPYYKSRAIRDYVAGLKRTGRVLGAVRDLDVFMERALSYLGSLPPERSSDLDPLLKVWEKQREQARGKMIDYLDGDRYRDFVDAFHLFLQTPWAAARKDDSLPPTPTQVCHIVPKLIYERWAGVQAFSPLLEDAPVSVLHALRIACKRLRYTLEFFEEILGPEAKGVITEVVCLQDHLGSLNDADVANALLSDFLFAPRGSKTRERIIAPGVVSYLATQQSELQTLIVTFPDAWQRFNRPEVRRWLAEAVSVL